MAGSLLGAGLVFLGGCSSAPTRADLTGQWQVDLRPAPDAAAYTQPMTLEITDDGSLVGSFYQTQFDNGEINDAWGDVVIGFATSDGSSNYAHSARMLTSDHIEGQTFSPERGFVMPWRATRVQPDAD